MPNKTKKCTPLKKKNDKCSSFNQQNKQKNEKLRSIKRTQLFIFFDYISAKKRRIRWQASVSSAKLLA